MKRVILKKCVEVLEGKTSIVKEAMETAQASANNETKSSAGDKYETGRAMSQNERDMNARQLAELLGQQKTIRSINPDRTCEKVELGALIKTTNTIFFISVGLGALKVGDMEIMTISAISPIAQAMLDLKTDDRFEWMKKKVEILEIE